MGYIVIKPVQPILLGRRISRKELLEALKGVLPGSVLLADHSLLKIQFHGRNELAAIISRLNVRIDSLGVPPNTPRYLPIKVVCVDEGAFSEETDWLWQLAPVGAILVPSAKQIPGAIQWLYGWDLICLGRGMRLDRMLFPLRRLLLLGEGRRECFFCGSLDHSERRCPLIDFSTVTKENGRQIEILSLICRTSPDRWASILKSSSRVPGSSENDSKAISSETTGPMLIHNLSALLADIRRPFQPSFAVAVCRSGAVNFSDMGKIPDRRFRPGPLKEALDAASMNKLEACAGIISQMDEEGQGTDFYILKGFCLLFRERLDRAMAAWLEAERCARTPLRKGYAALLQSRLFFLKKDHDAAMDAVMRARSADEGALLPIYWQMVMTAHAGRCQEAAALMAKIEMSPELLVSMLCDPLSIPCEETTEQVFRRLWCLTEEQLKKRVESIEELIDLVAQVFGHESISEPSKKFMEWRGKWAQMGLGQLKAGEAFLAEISDEIVKAASSRLLALLKELFAKSEYARRMIDALPEGREGLLLKKRCADFVSNASKLVNKKRSSDIKKLAEHGKEAGRLLSDYERLEADCTNLFQHAMKIRLIKKYSALGVALLMLIWLVIYLYVMS